MEGLDFILEQIKEGLMDKLTIAILAVAFWIIKAEGMSAENLIFVMDALGFVFNEQNKTLTINETTYTIYELIHYCVENIYPTSKILFMATMQNITKKSEKLGYITLQQRTLLDSMLVKIKKENVNA